MAEFPYYCFYPGDFAGKTQHLSTFEKGVYRQLLDCAWNTDDCALPNDDVLLARYAGIRLAQWLKLKPIIMPFWDILDGKITNNRLLIERTKCDSLKHRGKQGGVASAAAKALKNKNPPSTQVSLKSNSSATQVVPSHTHNHTHIRVDAKDASTAREINLEFENEFWPKYPHKVGKRDAKKAYANARKRAEKQPILDGLDRYIASKPQDRNWCNPSTFLNQDRWTDEPAISQDGKPDPRNWRATERQRAIEESRKESLCRMMEETERHPQPRPRSLSLENKTEKD